jgi:hypothetical protein
MIKIIFIQSLIKSVSHTGIVNEGDADSFRLGAMCDVDWGQTN